MTNGPLTALANGGVYAYGAVEHVPVEHLQRDELLGRRRIHHCIGSRHADGDGRHAGFRFVGQPGLGRTHGNVLSGAWCPAPCRSR